VNRQRNGLDVLKVQGHRRAVNCGFGGIGTCDRFNLKAYDVAQLDVITTRVAEQSLQAAESGETGGEGVSLCTTVKRLDSNASFNLGRWFCPCGTSKPKTACAPIVAS